MYKPIPFIAFSILSTFALLGVCHQPVTTSVSPQAPAPIERRAPADSDLEAASNLIGQALFLRCFCGDDTLSFTATGSPELRAKAKATDWTLSGIDIQKVQRR